MFLDYHRTRVIAEHQVKLAFIRIKKSQDLLSEMPSEKLRFFVKFRESWTVVEEAWVIETGAKA